MPPWVLPAGLVTAVLGINLEAVAFSALVNSVWTPQQYHCASLHIHKLNFDPSRVAWACKSCGKSLMHGFKVAFNCKKCDYSCCLACYRRVASSSSPWRTALLPYTAKRMQNEQSLQPLRMTCCDAMLMPCPKP